MYGWARLGYRPDRQTLGRPMDGNNNCPKASSAKDQNSSFLFRFGQADAVEFSLPRFRARSDHQDTVQHSSAKFSFALGLIELGSPKRLRSLICL